MPSISQREARFWIEYRDPKTRKLIRKSAGDTRVEALEALSRAHMGLPD